MEIALNRPERRNALGKQLLEQVRNSVSSRMNIHQFETYVF